MFLWWSNVLVEVLCSKSVWRRHQPCCWDPPGKFCFSAAESYIALAVLALLHPFRNEDDTPSPLCSLLLGSQNNTVHAKSDKISWESFFSFGFRLFFEGPSGSGWSRGGGVRGHAFHSTLSRFLFTVNSLFLSSSAFKSPKPPCITLWVNTPVFVYRFKYRPQNRRPCMSTIALSDKDDPLDHLLLR